MMMKPSFMNLKGRLAGLAFPALFIVFAPLSAAWAEHKVIDGTVTGSEFIGNSVVTDSAAGHSVTVVSGGGFDGDAVIGGFAEVSNGTGSATATGNSVTISGGEVKVTEAVIGGGADVFFNSGVGTGSATATDNSVTISDGEVTGYVIGGEADTNEGTGSATVIGNSVTISGGQVVGEDVLGGYAKSKTLVKAEDNSVTISGGEVTAEAIVGGFAESDSGTGAATATGNSVTISGGEVKVTEAVIGGGADVFGGGIGSATATGNSLTISGGEVTGYVIGGEADTNDGGGSATVIGNSVTISGGKVLGGKDVLGGYAKSKTSVTATDNSVTISGGEVTAEAIVGGFAESDGGTGAATATGNSVTIIDGKVTGIVIGGGADNFNGTSSATVEASGNEVFIRGGEVTGDVIGGEADSNNGGGSAVATGNKVIISGGTVTGDVIGGYAKSLTSFEATANTVTISGNPILTGANLYGGYTDAGPGTGDYFTGNTLNVWDYQGSKVNSVANFQYYDFLFPVTQTGPVLEVTGTAILGAGTGNGSTVTASTFGGSDPWGVGDSIVLIDAGTLTPNGFDQTEAEGWHGATGRYTWSLASSGGALTATVDSVEAAPEAESLSEGFLGSLAQVIQGADLAAGQGLTQAVGAVAGGGLGSFGAFGGGAVRHNTGSHVDTRGFSLMAGLAKGLEVDPGRLTLGVFMEYGTGSYDTYNSFNNIDINGDGKTWNLGGGLLGRLDFSGSASGRFYTEGSLRAGRVHNEYKNGDLGPQGTEYDTSTTYYGLHLGGGHIWALSELTSLDLYGKYFWTRQGSDSVTLTTGDRVDFGAVDSHRLRLGGRLAHDLSEAVSPYVGAAYEHEFDARAKASTALGSLQAPSPRGGTGVGELGLSFKPSATGPLSLDLGLQGYVGKREGVTGSLQLKFEF